MFDGRERSTLPKVTGAAGLRAALARVGKTWRLPAAALLAITVGCQPGSDRRAVITVGTYWGGEAGEVLHRELARIGGEFQSVSVQVRSFSFGGLADYLAKGQSLRGEPQLDLVIVPNDWLGELAERGVIGELPQARVESLQESLVRQALLAVSDRNRVLAYPVSAEVLALVYDPHRFPSPPRSLDDILHARVPATTLPFAVDIGSAYHLTPFMTSYQGSIVDIQGNLLWDDAILARVLRRLSPLWQHDSAWRAFAGDDLASLQLQLFAEGRLASFPTGPWMLEALEQCGRPFAVMPMPAFSDAPHRARALVGYQCAAVIKDSRWVDLALEIGARLVEPSCNERLNRASRRLSVLMGAYKTEAAMASPGAVGFLRALEGGQFFPASASWSEGFRHAGLRLQRLAHRSQPPSPRELEELFAGGAP